MIPILFDSNSKTFDTNGIGRLADTISCTVTEERNGPYELEMTYPITGVHYSEITLSKIIVVKASPKATLQAFRVYRISRPIGGKVTINARHISYQLSYIPVRAFSANSLAGALSGFKSNALESCPFTLTADFTSSSSFAIPLPASIKSYLAGRDGSIVDIYGNGAEWEWDNYSCILHAHRGANRGVVLRYGKNLIDANQEVNIENTITGIVSYWKSDEITVALPTPEESSTAKNFPFPRTVVMDFSDKFDNAPTVAELREETKDYMIRNNVGIPKVSIDVSFVNLADTIEYKDGVVQDIYLCDTVTVDFQTLGVQTTAKVIETTYDVLKERYESIKVGDSTSSVSSTIEEQADAISARPTVEQTQNRIDRATGVLNSGLRGHVIINRNEEGWANEILFLDNENVAKAKNVLRINNNGIGFSSTGYNGPYYQSWTIDGHFGLGGVNNSNGDFTIYDGQTPNPKKLGEWNNNGLQFFDSAETLLLKVNHGGLFLYDNTGKKVLAQLTNKGLNVYDGSIEGGYINIGNGTFTVDKTGKVNLKKGSININNKFEVTDQGIMKAVDGTFSGKITGGTINIGNKFVVNDKAELKATFTGGSITIGNGFKVDTNGKMTATSAELTDGKIKIGSKFEVKEDGTMTATGATFSGNIKAGTIKIGNKFEVKEDGKMVCNGAEFTGDIKGSKIVGSSFESKAICSSDDKPMFKVTDDEFKFLDYHAANAGSGGEGYYLEKWSGVARVNTLGFGDNDGWLLWAGWRDPDSYPDTSPEEVFAEMDFGIHHDDVFAYELFLQSLSYGGRDFCSVSDCINSLEIRVGTLEALVNGLINSAGGGGE